MVLRVVWSLFTVSTQNATANFSRDAGSTPFGNAQDAPLVRHSLVLLSHVVLWNCLLVSMWRKVQKQKVWIWQMSLDLNSVAHSWHKWVAEEDDITEMPMLVLILILLIVLLL